MGIIRKALLISTGGLATFVLPDEKPRRVSDRPGATTKAKAKAAPANAAPANPAPAKARQSTPRPAKRAAKKPAPRRQPQAKPSSITAATTPIGGTAYELECIANLHREGALSVAEFAAAKAKILGAGIGLPEDANAPPTFPAVEASITAARGLADVASDGGSGAPPRGF